VGGERVEDAEGEAGKEPGPAVTSWSRAGGRSNRGFHVACSSDRRL